MKIKYKNYEIELSEHSYDLYQTRPPKQFQRVKDKDGDVRVCHGYFSNLDNAIKNIIHLELFNREGIVDLTSFLELYKTIWDDITSTINGGNNNGKKIHK